MLKRRRHLSVYAVAGSDWMKYRPYKRFDPAYDSYYLRLSDSVFRELNSPEHFFHTMLERKQLIELAVVLTSWFEDYANEIGIWAAFVRKNQELYGYRLPFFNLDGYDPDDLNPQDIAYLCWHYCCKSARKFISPDAPGLHNIGEVLTEVFDTALEDAPGTDFYDQYLSLGDDVYFFEIKVRLHWMAFENYLLGPEYERRMNLAVEEMMKERAYVNEWFHNDTGKLLYTIQDDYLYKTRASFLAFSTPEWLAETVRGTEALRADIRSLNERVIGEFVFEKADERLYSFRHWQTGRIFEVRRESVEMQGIQQGFLVFTSLVSWQGEWWVSGTLAAIGVADSAETHRKKNAPDVTVTFYAWPEDKRQSLRDITDRMESAHLMYFGERLVFFTSEKAMIAAFEASNDFYNAYTEKGGLPVRSAPIPGCFTDPQLLPNGRGEAVFFEPGEGVFVSSVVALLAYRLSAPALDDRQAADLFFDFLNHCTPFMMHYLLERFSDRNLRFPVTTTTSLSRHLDFLLRFYNPDGFGERLPNTSFRP